MTIAEAILPDQIMLVFPGEPKHKQSTRISRDGFINKKTGKRQFAYADPKVKAGENAIAWIAVQQLPKGFIPWDCGVIVIKALYVFPIPASLTKREKQIILSGGIVYHTKNPIFRTIHKRFTSMLYKAFYLPTIAVCAT